MISFSIKDDLRSFRRSWVHHTGMQLATLTVLAGTLSVIAFVLAFSLNFKRLVASWGDGVHMTVYLMDDLDEDKIQKLRAELKRLPGVQRVGFVPKEKATEKFKSQMATYAPGLLSDSDFSNPFPASFNVGLKGGVHREEDLARLETMAKSIATIPGVEDVSYGQSWLKTYSSIVSTFAAAGGALIAVLLAGGIFVVGNSIRASIASRREEIAILELVGATRGMIRRPYIVEGFMMGGMAASLALAINYILFLWQVSYISESFALARIAGQFSFIDMTSLVAFIFASATLGGVGAWLTIRRINDGWASTQGTSV